MMPFGIIAICWGQFIYNIIATILNTRYTNTLIGLSFKTQMKDFMPYFGCSVVMAAVVWFVTLVIPSYGLQLIVGIPTGALVYILLIFLFLRSSFHEFVEMIQNNFLHRNKG